MIEYILLAIIVLQFSYTIFKDILHRGELEKLHLKLMARNIDEYTLATEPAPKKSKPEIPDPNVEFEDVDLETLIKAKDQL